jgi:hypothetical protein
MTASVSLTMGVTRLFNSVGPARLTAYIDREFQTQDKVGDETTPSPSLLQDSGNLVKDSEHIGETVSPTPKKSNTPAPAVRGTSAPTQTPAPAPTPSPTPIPTPIPDPAHCSIPLIYKIGSVAPIFFERGFSRQNIVDIVHESVKEWEDALGKDLFYHDENISGNINFNNESATNNAEGYGILTGKDEYKNGTIGSFSMKIYGQSLFTFIDVGSFSNYGGPADKDTFEESLIRRTVLKQLGHAIGLDSLPYEQASKKDSVMIGGGKWAMTSYMPKLSSDDISFAKSFCN